MPHDHRTITISPPAKDSHPSPTHGLLRQTSQGPRSQRGFRRLLAGCLSTVLIGLITTFAASPASAVTQPGYPNALVQFGASARSLPYLGSNTYEGFVTHPLGTLNNQTAAVLCWYDGDWATGNYTTNRWFKVEVATTYFNAVWAFVHASYVYNQPTVRQCIQTQTGLW